eukprot:9125928-Pyramimonas_sp.AAC.1
MSSAEPTDHDIQSEQTAGIMNIQAKEWLSAETAAQPLASQSVGSQEGALGLHNIDTLSSTMKLQVRQRGDHILSTFPRSKRQRLRSL